MRNSSKNPKGSITVFLSIILFTVVSFIFVLIDATRINAAKNQLIIASDNAAESTMAAFDRKLFSEYGLFAFDGTTSDELAKKVFKMNIDPNYEALSPRETAMLLNIGGEPILKPMAPLFTGTDVFKQQMIYAMKYQGTENLALSVLDRLKSLIEAAEQAVITEDLNDISKQMKELQDILGSIEDGKLNAQRGIIALTLANKEPEFYIKEKYIKNEDFDTQIGKNDLLKMVDESIGELFFSGKKDGDEKINKNFIEAPYQNIYVYKYAQNMVQCYRRTFEDEYNKTKSQYQSELEQYEKDLAKYEADKASDAEAKKDYDKAYADYKKAHDEWSKADPATRGDEPEPPDKPTYKNTPKPNPIDKPEILNVNLNDAISSINKFSTSLDQEAKEQAQELVANKKKHIGYYIQKIDESTKSLGDFIGSTDRKALEKKITDLESKLGSSSLNENAKDEVKSMIEAYKKIVQEDNLNLLYQNLVEIKGELVRFRDEVYNPSTAISNILNKIQNEISSSTKQITTTEGKNTIGPFMDLIYSGLYSRSKGQSYGPKNPNAVTLVKDKFKKDNSYSKVSDLAEFKDKIIKFHNDMKILEYIKSGSIEKDSIDIGEKIGDDNNPAEKVVDNVDKEHSTGISLKKILEKMASTGKIDLSPLPGEEKKGSEGGIGDFEALMGYKDAFGNAKYDQSLLDKIYLTEYIMTNFKDMIEYANDDRIPKEKEGDTVLDYEIEAIVRANGCYDDQKNKEAMKNWIKVVRIACNTVTILSSNKMKDYTYRTAEITCTIMAAGFSLIPYVGGAIAKVIRSKPFIKVVQLGLILGWADMEANIDAADIFRGYFVPVIKKPEEWVRDLGLNLDDAGGASDKEIADSLDNMEEPKIPEDKAYNTQPDSPAKKLKMASYTDYLRVRLLIGLLVFEKDIVNATKDVVYANMNEASGGSFDYKNYYAGMEIEVESSVNTWFNNDAFGSGGKVNFNKFSYKKRYN